MPSGEEVINILSPSLIAADSTICFGRITPREPPNFLIFAGSFMLIARIEMNKKFNFCLIIQVPSTNYYLTTCILVIE